MRLLKSWIVAIALIMVAATGVYAENVVQLPFGENIPSFAPYYWQLQHILAQGTLFEGLFGYEPDPAGMGGLKVVPVVADTWKVSADGKTWTIALKKTKKWSNGDPVTAKDFEWAFQYIGGSSMPDVPVWAGPLQKLANGWKYKGGGVAPDELGIKAVDNYTLVFTLDMPTYDFNCFLAVGTAMPLHRATVEKWGPNEWWKPEHFVGNGPYVPQSWVPNKEVVLVKNKNYVGTCGNVDKVVLKNFVQSQSQIQAYQAGEIDLAWITSVSDLQFVNGNKDLKAAYHETPSDLSWQGYQISRGFSPALDDVRVRQAFAMAIDRETLAKTVLAGMATPAYMYWTDKDAIGGKMKPIKYDVKAAQKLLADAGYPGGKGLPTLKFYTSGNMPEAEYIADQWKKNLGVDVQIENLERGIYDNTYVWVTDSPASEAGFTRINSSMNSFDTGGLDKNGNQFLWSQGFPADVRKKRYDLEQERIAYLTKEGGLTQAEWDTLVAYKNKLLPQDKAMVSGETNKIWKADMSRTPTFDQQFDDMYANWKKAADDKTKTAAWRDAWRLLLNEEKTLLEYNSMYASNKNARRLRWDITNQTFDNAVKQAPAYNQVLQDAYYLVPVYFDKVVYLQRPTITSAMPVYKFAWGPHPFNFRFLNVKK